MSDDYASTKDSGEGNAMNVTHDAAATGGTDEIRACRLRIRGLVQGVGFRYALAVEAQALGLAGWVRNRHDGSVEALLQGAPAAIEALADWAHRGPPAARVTAVERSPTAVDAALAGFAQHPDA